MAVIAPCNCQKIFTWETNKTMSVTKTSPETIKPKAIEIFKELENGVLELCKAADVYAMHIMAKLRNSEPDTEVINRILFDNSVSFFNLVGDAYRDDEIKILQENKSFRRIGEQILLSSYAALEIYFIEKFKEYYRFLCKDAPQNIVEETLKRFSFRNLDEIKRHYDEVLGIHLPTVEMDRIVTTNKANFEPESCWDAICMLAKERNNIAHTGAAKDYQVVTLLDSWYPFEFVRRWVMLFDYNFDMSIYEKREPPLIKEYKKRFNDTKVKK